MLCKGVESSFVDFRAHGLSTQSTRVIDSKSTHLRAVLEFYPSTSIYPWTSISRSVATEFESDPVCPPRIHDTTLSTLHSPPHPS